MNHQKVQDYGNGDASDRNTNDLPQILVSQPSSREQDDPVIYSGTRTIDDPSPSAQGQTTTPVAPDGRVEHFAEDETTGFHGAVSSTGSDRRPPLSRSPTLSDEQAYPEKPLDEIQSASYGAARTHVTMRSRLANAKGITSTYSNGSPKPRLNLEDLISRGMSRFGLAEQKAFVHNLSIVITAERIRRSMPNAMEDVLDYSEKHKKLFAITVLLSFKGDDLQAAMQTFMLHKLRDEDLPISDLTADGNCTEHTEMKWTADGEIFGEYEVTNDLRSQTSQCSHTPQENAFHEPIWVHNKVQDFYSKQWGFLVPKFNQTKFIFEFGKNEILPFKDRDTRNPLGAGYFSVVYKAKMLTTYQDVIPSKSVYVPIAMKFLTHRPGEEYDIIKDYRNEAIALSTFNKKHENKHIVKGIGAFRQKDTFCILMELADGGSLSQLWSDIPNPHKQLNSSKILEFLEQFHGLANALSMMHRQETSQRQEYIGSNLDAPKNDPDGKHWRHGDLKPSNILRFENESSWLGTLKLGDLGRTKQHKLITIQRSNPTKELFGTKHYEPPEVWTDLKKQARSRLYDIWSFGCILFESVVWVLYGTSKLAELSEMAHYSLKESPYWTFADMECKTAKIIEHTSHFMDDVLGSHPECQEPSALRDLIVLARDKLLVIDISTGPRNKTFRISAEELSKTLENIFSRAKKDQRYLFKGSKDISVPKAMTSSNSPQIVPHLEPNRQLTAANFVTRRTRRPFRTEKGDSYLHNFDQDWAFEEDNAFAAKLLQRSEVDLLSLFPMMPSPLCSRCRTIDLTATSLSIKDTMKNLRDRSGRCEFCELRLRIADKFEGDETEDFVVEFNKASSGLRLASVAPGPPMLYLRRSPELCKRLDKGPGYVQIGPPKIPRAGSIANLSLLRAWLEDCDNNHPECHSNYSESVLPTRLISVGTTEVPRLHLIEPASLTTLERSAARFIALSHPWGTSPPHKHVCTMTSNIQAYMESIPDMLPKTLADAVKTTRALGVPYLWIDSLCVIQGKDGDFSEESERMETVFSSAYCVIAATSCDGSNSGFLDCSSGGVDRMAAPTVVNVTYRPEEQKDGVSVYVSVPEDDFENDVRDGALNRRGWVYQERALARRTIHFTERQTYWECGNGIRCETLTKMRNSIEAFLGDSNFPEYGLHLAKAGDIMFYEYLFMHYSTLSFSHQEDRPFAIRGIEQRLRRVLREKGRSGTGNFGIFHEYWGRGLLWQRDDNEERMARLTFGPNGGPPAPSWSWMGYTGAISFMQHDPHSVDWLNDEITFPWTKPEGNGPLPTNMGSRSLGGKAYNFSVPRDGRASQKQQIVYEQPDLLGGRALKCFVIGRSKSNPNFTGETKNYVLIISKKDNSDENVYERIGAGFLYESSIDFEEGHTLRVTIE